ncbi:MAG: CRISPR-associated endonuclease Cas1 [Thermodesulfobacteriota bacterium]
MPPVLEKDLPDLLPARMLNEYAYCRRLGYLMWVQGEWADNAFTEDGKYQHRRVDAEEGDPPSPEDETAPKAVRSVMLSAPKAGLIARMDLLEVEGRRAVPVDTKRGHKPDLPEGAHEPERVQLMAQGLVLKENGYDCDHGVLYFAGSRDRVAIPFTPELEARTLALAEDFRAAAGGGKVPPPLKDSPKCDGCSLVGVCLPDETNLLQTPAADTQEAEPRRLIPARDDALPIYVQAQGGYVGKKGDELIIRQKDEPAAAAKLFETSQLSLFGNVQVTTPVVRELCSRGIPILYFSSGGWFYGLTQGEFHKNVELRLGQYRAALETGTTLALARRFVAIKIRNCRTLLRRNAEGLEPSVLDGLKEKAAAAESAESVESLLGIEGSAAREYFSAFPLMLKKSGVDNGFSFEGRNRRPPRDPVNALLSLAYALLAKDLTVAALAAGFDPFLGFFHRPRYGRPSLALDLMEEFRPLVADSVVIGTINTGVVGPKDFIRAGGGVALKEKARKEFILAYERRMDQLVRHPVFGYQISYRRVLEVQTRLLGRYLLGEIPEYPAFTTR